MFLQLTVSYTDVPNTICSNCHNNLIQCLEIRNDFIHKQIEFEKNISLYRQIKTADVKHEPIGEILAKEEVSEISTSVRSFVNDSQNDASTTFEMTSHVVVYEPKDLLDEKKHQCVMCGKFVRNLREHVKFTHNQAKKTYFCDNCNYSCYLKTKIERHLQKHIPKKFRNLVKCSECSFLCSRKDALKSHIKTIHREREKSILCSHCQKTFYNSSQLNIHIKSVHQNIRNHLCQYCGKGFFTHKEMTMHVQRHFDKTEKCTDCGALFYCSVDLKRHIRHKHEPARIGCPHCQSKFHTNSQLKIHIKTRHENLKEHVCSFCGANFGQYNNMKRHIDSVHKALRIYCPVKNCSYSITRKDKFKNHLTKTHKNLDESVRELIFKNVKQQ